MSWELGTAESKGINDNENKLDDGKTITFLFSGVYARIEGCTWHFYESRRERLGMEGVQEPLACMMMEVSLSYAGKIDLMSRNGHL